MCNYTPQPLSENGSFEKIVNHSTAAARAKQAAWVRKRFRMIVVLLAAFLVNLILWLAGVVPSVLSVYITEILSVIVSFCAGRIYEKFCK